MLHSSDSVNPVRSITFNLQLPSALTVLTISCCITVEHLNKVGNSGVEREHHKLNLIERLETHIAEESSLYAFLRKLGAKLREGKGENLGQ